MIPERQIKVPFETTLHVRDRCLCLHVQRGARSLARRFDQALRPFGLTNWQFSLMMSLNRPSPPTVGAVAEVLAMDRTSVTAALKALERRKLVKVAPDPADRRSRRVSLTPRGSALLSGAVGVWEDTHRALEAALGESEAELLRRLLAALLRAA